jgi:hypothetical protein
MTARAGGRRFPAARSCLSKDIWSIAMANFPISRWSRAGVIGTIGLFAGFLSHMDPLAIRSLQAADAGASSSARATASSSSTSSTSGGCHSEARSSAQATIVVDGEKKTVRQEDADRSDGCGGRVDSEARAVIDGPRSGDGEAGQ